MSEAFYFSPTHQWVRTTATANEVEVGISDHAQDALGDIVFVELPEAGKTCKAGEIIGAIESVKTASEILSPVSGTLIACHQALEDAPEQLNEAPLSTWIYRLQVEPETFTAERETLMLEEAYATFLEQ